MKPTSLTDGDYTSSLDEAFSFVNAFNFQSATATTQFPVQTEHDVSTAAENMIQDQTHEQTGTTHSRKQILSCRQQNHHQARASSHGTKANCVRQQRRVRNAAELSSRQHRNQVQSDEEYCFTDEPTDEKCSGVHVTHSDAASWLQQAALQYEELQKSEQNSKLRSKLSCQVELQKCLETELREAVALQRDCRVLTTQKRSTPIKIEPRVTQGCPWIRTEQLHKSMCALYRDTDAILRQIASCSDLTSIFSSSQSKRCPVRGPIFELKTSAPVSCSIKSLGDVLWRTLGGCKQEQRKVQVEEEKEEDEKQDVKMEEGDPAPPSTPDQKGAVQEDSCEKWCTQNLSTQYGDIQVHGACVVRKFESDGDGDGDGDGDVKVKGKAESDSPLRIVVTFASSVAASESRDLVFHETGWFVLTQLKTTSSSLFQTFYRLQIQNAPTSHSSVKSEHPRTVNSDDAYLQELVMNALSNRTRKYHQQIQDKLLAHSEESGMNLAVSRPFGVDFVPFDSNVFHGAPC